MLLASSGGLIVGSNEMTGSSIQWAESSYQSLPVVNGTSTNFGTGAINSSNIIAMNGTGITYAAGLARTCSDGGYDDWFLPSWGELHTAYTNIGTLPGILLFSSSEVTDSAVHSLNPGNGNRSSGIQEQFLAGLLRSGIFSHGQFTSPEI